LPTLHPHSPAPLSSFFYETNPLSKSVTARIDDPASILNATVYDRAGSPAVASEKRHPTPVPGGEAAHSQSPAAASKKRHPLPFPHAEAAHSQSSAALSKKRHPAPAPRAKAARSQSPATPSKKRHPAPVPRRQAARSQSPAAASEMRHPIPSPDPPPRTPSPAEAATALTTFVDAPYHGISGIYLALKHLRRFAAQMSANTSVWSGISI
jgi:hypothetical protein